MIRGLVLLCALYFLALTSYSVNAMTNEQRAVIREHFEKLGIECIGDNPITEQDINDLRAKNVPSGPAAPCFLACVLKKCGVMDDHGMLKSETALDLARKVFDDEEELKIIADYLHSCHTVNSEAVSDGEKGCERAISAYKCMKENAPKFGIDV
ncbi:uncharacterized protein LOC114366121 [Ostrinia furnacalis]|uniref:Odorant binding protein 9 n=1 Tax=Ostrinia furnacalis TaxID=93504 RepID=A0A1B4ZBI6_OSTFU|nr:uncharacterized protein LOC114366121 [Ostrinia furnacalis]BAV56796.1 odorant binding protein 9 [Ostrinia furnacalis]